MAGEGRPTDCTPKVRDRMVHALKMGQPVRAACRYAGVHYSTHYDWLKWADEEKPGPFVDYANAVREAAVEGEQLHLSVIVSAAKDGEWRASVEALRFMRPEEYARQRTEISGPDGGPVQVQNLAAEIAAQLATTADKDLGIPEDLG